MNKKSAALAVIGLAVLMCAPFIPATVKPETQSRAAQLAAVYEQLSAAGRPEAAIQTGFPLLKKDGAGRVWAAREEWLEEEGAILLSRVSGPEETPVLRISRPRGLNHSPDFAFDAFDSPWIAWVCSEGMAGRVLVQDVRTNRAWVLSPNPPSAVTAPRIVIAPGNTPWVFWEGNESGKEGIFYSRFSGLAWTAPRMVATGNPYPDVNPDALVDGQGRLILAWSGYDGNDYEIYASSWAGSDWAPAVKFTDGPESDGFPAAADDGNGRPVLAWVQSSPSGPRLLMKYLEGDSGDKGLAAFGLGTMESPPRIFLEAGSLGAAWKSGKGAEVRLAPLEKLKDRRTDGPLPAPQTFILNPGRIENQYIGFGDSITYGTINHEYYPELGYIPRLQVLLTKSYGASRVINEGLGGELTGQGLSRIDDVINQRQARYLLLMEGTNDVIFHNVAIETMAFNLREMARKCLQAGIFPAIATIIPRRDIEWVSPVVRERFFALNEEIRKIPAALAIPLVDQYKAFFEYPAASGGLLSLLSEDLKHPNEKGYQVMAQTWFNGIKSFPFPPANFQVKRRDFYFKSPFTPVAGVLAVPSPSARSSAYPQGRGNLATWTANPKILEKSAVKGYKLYRRKKSQPDAMYQLIATVTDGCLYFDKTITLSESYSYLVSTLRTDGVEGPCSGPIIQ